MNLADALPIVRAAVERSSQQRVAKEIGVDGSVLSRWFRELTTPEGASRERIISWAARTVGQSERALSLNTASRLGVADELVPIAEIRGYARAVARMLESALDEQRRVIDALGAYASQSAVSAKSQAAETTGLSSSELRQRMDEAVRRELAADAAEPRTAAPHKRPKRA